MKETTIARAAKLSAALSLVVFGMISLAGRASHAQEPPAPPPAQPAAPTPAVAPVQPPAPTPPVAGGANVQIRPDDEDDRYQVVVSSAGQNQSCAAPCNMSLQPGPAVFSVSGEGEFVAEALIPAGSSEATIEHESRGVMIAGGVLATICVLGGAGTVIVGIATEDSLGPVLAIAVPTIAVGIVGLSLILASGDNEVTIEPAGVAAAPSGRPTSTSLTLGAFALDGQAAGLGASLQF